MRKNIPQDSRGPGKGTATPLLRCFCHARVRFHLPSILIPFRRRAGWMSPRAERPAEPGRRAAASADAAGQAEEAKQPANGGGEYI